FRADLFWFLLALALQWSTRWRATGAEEPHDGRHFERSEHRRAGPGPACEGATIPRRRRARCRDEPGCVGARAEGARRNPGSPRTRGRPDSKGVGADETAGERRLGSAPAAAQAAGVMARRCRTRRTTIARRRRLNASVASLRVIRSATRFS